MATTEPNDFQMNHPTIISLLYVGSFLVGITSVIGVVLAYMWRGEDHASWEDSHYRYLIRTFWIGFVYAIIAGILSVVTLGLLAFVFFGLVSVWFIVRAIKSLTAAQKQMPMANVETWLF